MSRTYFSGPVKSTAGFEIGAIGTNTTVIDSDGAITAQGAITASNITSSGTLTSNGSMTTSAVSVGAALTTGSGGSVAGRRSVQTVSSATAATTLTVSDSGKIVIITATAGATINLPSATVTGQSGTQYTFIQGAACTAVHTLDPATGDKIMGYLTVGLAGSATTLSYQSLGTAGAGTDNAQLTLGSSATNNNIGTRVSIVGEGSGGWIVTDSFGLGFGYATT